MEEKEILEQIAFSSSEMNKKMDKLILLTSKLVQKLGE